MRSSPGWFDFPTPRCARLGLGAFNLALISLYFAPAIGGDALRALLSPYHGLELRGHAAGALYVRELFDFGFRGLIVASHVLAGVKLVIAAAFLAYVIEFARAYATGRAIDRQTTDVVLILAAVGVAMAFIPALALGETAALRLAATQLAMVTGAIMVIVIERQGAAVRQAARETAAPLAPAFAPQRTPSLRTDRPLTQA